MYIDDQDDQVVKKNAELKLKCRNCFTTDWYGKNYYNNIEK